MYRERYVQPLIEVIEIGNEDILTESYEGWNPNSGSSTSSEYEGWNPHSSGADPANRYMSVNG